MRGIPAIALAALLVSGCARLGLGATLQASSLGPPDLAGAWVLQRGTGPSGAVRVPEDVRFVLSVDGTEVGGQACNHYGGRLQQAGTAIRIDVMSMTEMACREDIMQAEAAYHAALLTVREAARSDDVLTLSGDGAELVYDLLPPVPDAALDGTRWILDTLIRGDAASSVGGEAWLRLDPDGRLAGSTGCRELSGVYVVVGDELLPTSLAAEGECSAQLAGQDRHVVEVLEGGAIVAVEGDRLTLIKPDGTGLGFAAAR